MKCLFNSQDSQVNIRVLDFPRNITDVIRVYLALTVCNETYLSFPLVLLGEGVNHIDRNHNGRYGVAFCGLARLYLGLQSLQAGHGHWPQRLQDGDVIVAIFRQSMAGLVGSESHNTNTQSLAVRGHDVADLVPHVTHAPVEV